MPVNPRHQTGTGSAGGGSGSTALVVAHMVFALAAVLVCFPVAVWFAATARRGVRRARRQHLVWQLGSVAVLLVSVLLIVVNTQVAYGSDAHFESPHAKLGLALVVLLLVQLAVGAVRANVKFAGLAKQAMHVSHRVAGYLLMLLLVVQVVLGFGEMSGHWASVHVTQDVMGLTMAYTNTVVLLEDWVLNSVPIYVGTLAFCVYVGFWFETLKHGPAWIQARLKSGSTDGTALIQKAAANEEEEDEDEEGGNGVHLEQLPHQHDQARSSSAVSRARWTVVVLTGLIVAVRAFVGFIAMLIVMTFNIGLIAAIVAGGLLSSVLFPLSSSTAAQDQTCS